MNSIDNYFLPSDNLAAAKEFYQRIGLVEKFDFSDMGMIAYNVGQDEPAIILKDRRCFPDCKPTIWLVVNDVMKEYTKLKEAGVKFLSEPFQIHTGMACEFEDPSGNRLGITDYNQKTKRSVLIMKTCICCGMPMEKAADFAMGDESKDYCVYCAKPDGSMKTYEEALEGMTGFIVQTQGLDPEQACAAAKAALAELPAWKK